MNLDNTFPATNMPDADWWGALWPDPEGVLRRLGVDFGQSVLDLCCGDGHFTVPLAHIVGRAGRVVAFDCNGQMLARARSRAAREGIAANAILWVEGDARTLAGKLPSVPDYVFLANTFHGVPDPLALAREIYAVMMPGGQFTIVNWHHRPREETTVMGKPRGPETRARMSPDQVVDVVSQAGFRLHGVVELPPYHYGAVFDKPKNAKPR